MAGTTPGTTPGMVGMVPTFATASIAGMTGDGVGIIVRDGILSGIMAGIPVATTDITIPTIVATSTAMADAALVPAQRVMQVDRVHAAVV